MLFFLVKKNGARSTHTYIRMCYVKFHTETGDPVVTQNCCGSWMVKTGVILISDTPALNLPSYQISHLAAGQLEVESN